jgi:hypothetical protein
MSADNERENPKNPAADKPLKDRLGEWVKYIVEDEDDALDNLEDAEDEEEAAG